MNQKTLIAIIAAAVVLIAAVGIAVFTLGGEDNSDDTDRNNLVITEAGTYTGTYKTGLNAQMSGKGLRKATNY